jgi:hypothetical protein
MTSRQLHDTENPENRNLGNGVDLGKHTVCLAELDVPAGVEPLADELVDEFGQVVPGPCVRLPAWEVPSGRM